MLKVASVFSGIGSFEHSLCKNKIDHEIIFACDNNKYCKINYMNNYSPNKWYDNIKEINGLEYNLSIDLLVGGCPCQSFSIAGLRKGLEDDRGLLIYNYIKLIKDSQPKVFIFENVKGLLSHNKKKTFKWLLGEFEKCGYVIEYRVLSAKKLNFPQSRERIFVIGHRRKMENTILDKIKYKPLTNKLENYLEEKVDEKYHITNQKWQKWICSQKHLDKQKMKINGDYIICQTARQYSSWFGNFILEHKENANFNYSDIAKECIKNNEIIPFNYNKSFDYEYIIKNSILRRLTPTECLKLMGFENFKNKCSDTQLYKQCGNSIIVNMFDEIFNILYSDRII